MHALASYDYAIVRVVPRVERGEFLNVGIILFCRTRRFLRTQIALDTHRLSVFAPSLDLDPVPSRPARPHLLWQQRRWPHRPTLAIRTLQLARLPSQHHHPNLSHAQWLVC